MILVTLLGSLGRDVYQLLTILCHPDYHVSLYQSINNWVSPIKCRSVLNPQHHGCSMASVSWV